MMLATDVVQSSEQRETNVLSALLADSREGKRLLWALLNV